MKTIIKNLPNISENFKRKPYISPEVVTKNIALEMKMMAIYLGWVYFPYFAGKDPNAPVGWVDEHGFRISRTSKELPFLNNISKLKIVVNKIESTGYIFGFDLERIEELLDSKDYKDIEIGRAFKKQIWEECIKFIKEYNENIS